MTNTRAPIYGLVLYSLSIGFASAQPGTASPGVDPLAAEKVPNSTVVGQTKPPSRDASPTSVKPIERLTPHQAAADAISRKVCVGCAPDPTTTGTVSIGASAVRAAVKPDVQLDELRTASETKTQPDLDTVALASAHREQAKSADERTTGLWQSWVVSVCAGCGDQKPAKVLKLEDWPNRSTPLTTGSVDHKPPVATAHPVAAKQAEVQRHGSLEADLSPDNLNTIRRMSRQ